MPNVWAHLLFGEQVLARLGEEKLVQASDRRLFNMGCQGPDFLFYHHFLPWQKPSPLNQLGTEMHNRHCGPVLASLLSHVAGRPAGGEKPADASIVYVIGFLLHHILDRHVHPYVFYRSGFRKWDHQRFEVLMDTHIVRELTGLETWRTPAWKQIHFGSMLPDAVVEAFEQAAAYYPELASQIRRAEWHQAANNMVQAQRLFYDPTGFRKWLTLGKIEPLSYSRHIPDLDIMNLGRQPWADPSDGTTLYDDSVWMLWDAALEDALPIVASALQWLRLEAASVNSAPPSAELLRCKAETLALIGNRSYETGHDCESGAAILHADPIWPA